MTTILGVPSAVLYGQLLLGLINGAFYAMLSLGLAVIFGMMNIVNFAHGAQYMIGAMGAWLLLNYLGVGYWWALILAPLIVGAISIVIEVLLLRRLYKLDHLYGMLLTFGLALMVQGMFSDWFGCAGFISTNCRSSCSTATRSCWTRGRWAPTTVPIARRTGATSG